MPTQDDLYEDAMVTHGPALDRLAQSYEANPEDRRDRIFTDRLRRSLYRLPDLFEARTGENIFYQG